MEFTSIYSGAIIAIITFIVTIWQEYRHKKTILPQLILSREFQRIIEEVTIVVAKQKEIPHIKISHQLKLSILAAIDTIQSQFPNIFRDHCLKHAEEFEIHKTKIETLKQEGEK